MNAKMILAGRTCNECRFGWQPGGVVIMDTSTGDKIFPKKKIICNYENIVIYNPKGMEQPMNNFVDELHNCDKWEGK